MRGKAKINFLIILGILILCALIEVFVFNMRYFKLPDNEKKDFKISGDNIDLYSMEKTENGFESLTMDSNILIDSSVYKDILYLRIVDSNDSGPYEVTVSYPKIKKEGKTFFSDASYGRDTFIKIDSNYGGEIKLSFKSISPDSLARINEINIDNQFEFNFSRYFLMLSILLVISLLIYNFSFFSKRLHWAFLIISVLLGINFVFTTPTYYSYDELQHFIKAYQIASFDFGIENEKEIGWPESIEQFFYPNGQRIISYQSYKEKEVFCNMFSSNDYSNMKYYSSTAQNYLPTAYFPAAFGIALGKLLRVPFFMTFYLGRLFNLLFYAIIFCGIIKYSKIWKKTIFTLGLLPGMMYLTSSYSADPVTFSFAVAVVTLFGNMLCFKDYSIMWKHLIGFILCSVIMITGKMSYAPLVLLLFLIPNKKFMFLKKYNNKQTIGLKFFVLFILGLVTLFNLWYSLSSDLNQWKIEGVDVNEQIRFILMNIPLYVNICVRFVLDSFFSYFAGAIGLFAYSGVFPDGLILFVIIYLILIAILDNDTNNFELYLKDKISMIGIIIMCWGLTITFIYVSFNPVGSLAINGVQGRYFAPLLLPLLLLFKSSKISNEFKPQNLIGVILFVSSVLLALAALKLFFGFSL